MEQIHAGVGRQNSQRKNILIAAVAIIGLMILFPPKYTVTRNPIFNQSVSQSAGYRFLFDDPAGEQKAAAQMVFGEDAKEFVGSGIQWGKLLLQLAVVGGGAAFLLARSRP